MAISEKRYAAELLDKQGDAYKFDDIGCLLNFVKRNRPAVTAYFFVDQESGAWLKPEKAFFVRSSKFKTPMNSSIVAFADQEKAQAVAQETGGELLSFEQLTAREG
jgi:copper chaperone NosL